LVGSRRSAGAREPGDSLKYIPFSPYDPNTYLSFGADLRERFEANDAASFGIGPNRNADYLLSRTEAHADLRLGSLYRCSRRSRAILPRGG
jgi:Alginate export